MALAEDIGKGDVTSRPIIPAAQVSKGILVAKSHGVIAGTNPAITTCQCVSSGLDLKFLVKDGARVKPGQTIGRISGKTRHILAAERTMLNLLQHLSGVATLAARYVAAVKGTRARILDTRKTTPLWRDLEKQAVRAGGGGNHRMGLYDAVLIKDNHISSAGGIWRAMDRCRKPGSRSKLMVEVEAKTMAEVKEAFLAGADRIMLDNMSARQMANAVRWIKTQRGPKPEIEASGGVNLKTVRSIARTGVDFISVGALTHSAPALDISLLLA